MIVQALLASMVIVLAFVVHVVEALICMLSSQCVCVCVHVCVCMCVHGALLSVEISSSMPYISYVKGGVVLSSDMMLICSAVDQSKGTFGPTFKLLF